jgi:hypothetical protein
MPQLPNRVRQRYRSLGEHQKTDERKRDYAARSRRIISVELSQRTKGKSMEIENGSGGVRQKKKVCEKKKRTNQW